MLQVFRKFFHSSVGVFSALALIVMLALAFAAGDVANLTGSGGITGGDRVAKVGDSSIGTAQLTKQAQQALEGVRAQNPSATMKDLLAQGGLDQILDQMIDEEAMVSFGAKNGVVAGKRLVDSELAKIPAFQGAGGKFDENTYRGILAQRQLNDADVRDSFTRELVGRQLLSPAKLGASLPQAALVQYAALLKEHRNGVIGVLPSAAFAPKTPASPAEIGAWYRSHQAAYTIPERRVIRYAMFDESAAKNVAAPTDAEIAARFDANKARYAASESRKVTQLIVISESLAKDIAATVAKGTPLEAAAKAKGLNAASLGLVTKADLTTRSGAGVADAAFAAKQGAIAGPVKGALGWALVRVDGVESKPARTLDQVKPEIVAALTEEKRKVALAALTEKVSDAFDKGDALADTAKDLGLTLNQTGELTADGQSAGSPLPKELAPILKAAFGLEHEGQAQISELVAGKSFVIYDVAKITAAAPAPLDSIKARVAADIALDKGATAAKAAALKVLAGAKKGGELAPLLGGLGVAVPAPQPISMGRDQIAAMQGRIPPALGLLFAMAQGTTKLLPMAGNQGWFVVQLKQIVPGTVDAKDPMIAQVNAELSALAAREQDAALRRAIRAEVTVKRNDTAFKSVASQLAGGN
ncbi:peptidyl-prolyl cis-trans isomerase [Novosphingobium sp. UBA1939]|uniref:peptidyl-prolyl cis-trans isomerase n=1 Tax=Novosphingobium sp. UBA1939 TaxID=1946982 RepID=UPI0025ECD124|nr:peptidyl-prolyl cis-trans isomerase [Novosphingobium sp. UBA1939]